MSSREGRRNQNSIELFCLEYDWEGCRAGHREAGDKAQNSLGPRKKDIRARKSTRALTLSVLLSREMKSSTLRAVPFSHREASRRSALQEQKVPELQF